MPSLSVVQTLPSRRRKQAPALSISGEAERAVTKTVDRRRYSQPLRLKYQYTPAPANTIDSNDSG